MTLMFILPLLYYTWPDEEELKKRVSAKKEWLAQERMRHSLSDPTATAEMVALAKHHRALTGLVILYVFVPSSRFLSPFEDLLLTGLAMLITRGVLIERQLKIYLSKE